MPAKSPTQTATPDNQPRPPGSISAEEITGYLKGALQAVRIAYIFVGQLLSQVRDTKLYTELGYADLESYARERLQLGRSALYSYLRVYDWVARFHAEWLDPAPGLFIPELNDVVDLIWMERELERKDLRPAARAELEALKAKALAGSLTKKDVAAFRSRTRNTAVDGRKAFLSRMRALRAEGAKLAGMPPEIVSGLDDLIAILKNAIVVPIVVLEDVKASKTAKVA